MIAGQGLGEDGEGDAVGSQDFQPQIKILGRGQAFVKTARRLHSVTPGDHRRGAEKTLTEKSCKRIPGMPKAVRTFDCLPRTVSLDPDKIMTDQHVTSAFEDDHRTLDLVGHPFIVGIKKGDVGRCCVPQGTVAGRPGTLVVLTDNTQGDAVHLFGHGLSGFIRAVVGTVIDDDGLPWFQCLTSDGRERPADTRARPVSRNDDADICHGVTLWLHWRLPPV